MLLIYSILDFLLTLLFYAIFAQVILSWLFAFNVINMSNAFVRQVWDALNTMLEPIYRPIRRILPDFGALDLAPLVVILVIWLLQQRLLPLIFLSPSHGL